MKRNFTLTAILFFLTSLAFAQQIEIGQKAEQVKAIIEYKTKDHNRIDSYGNRATSRASWDAKYQNGKISEVVQCYSNQYLLDLRVMANFCKHYLMGNGRLTAIITQYENISVETIKDYYERTAGDRKVGEYYYTEDFQNYSRIYLHSNGLASIEWRAADINKLPKEIKNKIAQKQAENVAKEQMTIKEEERKKVEKENITSKVYDLYEHNQSEYIKALDKQKNKIRSYFKSEHFPSFEELSKREVKYERLQTTYNAYYKLEDHSREGQMRGGVYVAGSDDIRNTQSFKVVDGGQGNNGLMKYAGISIPTIEVSGYRVMTEALFENLKVDFTRGITEVRIKNGQVDFTKDEPLTEIKGLLIEKLKQEQKGNYIVRYELGEVVGDKVYMVEAEKIEKKGGFGKTVGGALLIGGLLLLI